MTPRTLGPALILALTAASAGAASAHGGGFGPAVETRFEMPAWVVWSAGALVVAVSFAVVGAFLTRLPPTPRSAGAQSAQARKAPGTTWRVGVGSLVMLALVLVACANAFTPASASLLPETLVWLFVWAALPIVAYLFGNAWEALNPWHALVPIANRLRGQRAPREYPAAWGAWPSVLLLLLVIGLEVLPGAAHAALPLSRLLLAYVLVTLWGMTVFGADAWLTHADPFTRAFRWWSAAAPLRFTRARLARRDPASALAALPLDGWDGVAFTVALLFGVNFDGFLQTRVGQVALSALAPWMGAVGAHWALLIAGFAVFMAAFVACAVAVKRAAQSLRDVRAIAGAFAASLVPIAAGYHAAHNVFYVYENAPRFLLALADPFGLGWGNLAHASSALALPDLLIPLAGAAQMLLIIVGHVAAVVVAHHLAMGAFPSRVQAVRSELPLTLVMVFYTFVGLWIVSRGYHAPLVGVA